MRIKRNKLDGECCCGEKSLPWLCIMRNVYGERIYVKLYLSNDSTYTCQNKNYTPVKVYLDYVISLWDGTKNDNIKPCTE